MRPNVGDLVKVFSPQIWYERRLQKNQVREYDPPFQVGVFLDDYWQDPDDEDRMGEWCAIILLNGEQKHIRSRNVEAFNA